MPRVTVDGERIFVPHPQCTASGGDCLMEGRCLGNCKRLTMADLERRVKSLEHELAQVRIQLVQLLRRK